MTYLTFSWGRGGFLLSFGVLCFFLGWELPGLFCVFEFDTGESARQMNFSLLVSITFHIQMSRVTIFLFTGSYQRWLVYQQLSCV
jgi:hypothetical protein